MTRLSHDSITIPGVLLAVYGLGVLLSGRAGSGKSSLALALINRGHRLISDDAPQFTRRQNDTIVGACPPLLQQFLDVRGLGMIHLSRWFGSAACQNQQPLDLIVQLDTTTPANTDADLLQRLTPMPQSQRLLGIAIPQRHLLLTQNGLDPALALESIVRDTLLRRDGYQAERVLSHKLDHALALQASARQHERV